MADVWTDRRWSDFVLNDAVPEINYGTFSLPSGIRFASDRTQFVSDLALDLGSDKSVERAIPNYFWTNQ